MSRSYKKIPHWGDRCNKFLANYANRRWRRHKFEDIRHNGYKKLFDSYNIRDYSFIEPEFEEYWIRHLSEWYAFWYKYKPFPDKKQVYKEWYTAYKRK